MKETKTTNTNRDLDEEEYEFNCCGIRHKRLDDLVAKVGFIVHIVIMLMDFHRNKWSWWVNLGSVLCYLALIYGISRRTWYLYLPYFCLNPILVITQVVLMLRTSYRGSGLEEGLWTAFFNFVTLTIFVVFITTIHLVSILIVLMRFQPFNEYTERKKRERLGVLAEYPIDSQPNENRLCPSIQYTEELPRDQSRIEVGIQELDRPPKPPIQNKLAPSRVKFSPNNDTFYYEPSSPNRTQVSRSFII